MDDPALIFTYKSLVVRFCSQEVLEDGFLVKKEFFALNIRVDLLEKQDVIKFLAKVMQTLDEFLMISSISQY